MYDDESNDYSSTPPTLNKKGDSDINKDVEKLAAELNELRPYENYDNAYNNAKQILCEANVDGKIRMDKVKIARERIKIKYYFREEVLSKTADNILEEFGLG